jgi:putative colanic acid biosynthesis acetyltransferase WcaF
VYKRQTLWGARIGRGAHVYGGVRIWAPWNLTVGPRAGIADGVIVYSMAMIDIGDDAVVSQGAHLCTGTHDYTDPAFTLHARPIRIGARAWVCAEAFVGPGVTVGEGAVLGARGVAFRDLEAWMVHAGNPAKAVKPRQVRPQPETSGPQEPTA